MIALGTAMMIFLAVRNKKKKGGLLSKAEAKAEKKAEKGAGKNKDSQN